MRHDAPWFTALTLLLVISGVWFALGIYASQTWQTAPPQRTQNPQPPERAHRTWTHEAELEHCWDADTCQFTAFDVPVRWAEIDVPERDGPCNHIEAAARRFLEDYLQHADRILLDSLRTGHYGRVIAHVYADDDGQLVNTGYAMLGMGFAVPYGEDTCPPRWRQ